MEITINFLFFFCLLYIVKYFEYLYFVNHPNYYLLCFLYSIFYSRIPERDKSWNPKYFIVIQLNKRLTGWLIKLTKCIHILHAYTYNSPTGLLNVWVIIYQNIVVLGNSFHPKNPIWITEMGLCVWFIVRMSCENKFVQILNSWRNNDPTTDVEVVLVYLPFIITLYGR